ncbi:hypothetical protein [Streptomyces pinistramenti]|uniref:hypothetical protein n=1 Tax=Streptomyces pinistramenti TaxID=2884812 RepID=UPI001D073186|nr:hypothetical protein [Streptomyces pinistramenti]MCB5911705.1 hypothetical protein [Streptomyces pinistramenti]
MGTGRRYGGDVEGGCGPGADAGRDGGGAAGGGAVASGGGGGDDVEALLRERLRQADERIEMPPGLWSRIQETASERRPKAVALPRRRPYAVAFAVAATVAAVALGAWWVQRPGGGALPSQAREQGVPVTVHNTESACRGPRTLECGLRLAKDPHRRYAERDNSAGRVWHGDVLVARCVVTDGLMVRDEQGLTSTRWYLVTTGEGVRGWLPGVRTRNTREVPVCPAGER